MDHLLLMHGSSDAFATEEVQQPRLYPNSGGASRIGRVLLPPPGL